jgi:GAF domain-containing protein
MSGTPESTLADPQQIITDLQRQLAECRAERDEALAERDEALEQQTATAEVLQVINSSPGDLTPVFDALLEKAMQLCEATFGGLTSFDGERFYTLALRGLPAEAVEAFREPWVAGPGTYHENLVRGEPLVHTDFGVADPARRAHPQSRAIMEMGKARTGLIIALCRDKRLLGSLFFYRQEIRPFTDKQIALLQNFAAQAVIAMENARLLNETREALEQQTATAEVLQVINSSPGDLTPVFDAMLSKAFDLCEGVQGSLWTFDRGQSRLAASRGLSADFVKVLREQWERRGPSEHHPMSRLMRGEHLVQILDMEASDLYRTGDPTAVAAVELGRVRTLIFVALLNDAAPVGVFIIARREVRPFSHKQIALVQNFAAQAVIAMENARLLGELRERTRDLEESLEYQTATSDVLNVISRSTSDVQPVLDTLVETAGRLCQAEMTLVSRREGGVYRMAASFGFPVEFGSFLRSHPIAPDRGTMVGRVVLDGGVVHVADVAGDPEYRLSEAITLGRQRTALGVPLLREGQPIGVIVLARQRVEPFTERQIDLVRTFADQAVIAIENARLLSELQARTDELTRSVAELQALEEVLRAVNSSLDLETVLATIISRAAQLSEADEGTIYEFDDTEEVFVPKSAFGMSAERVAALRERRVRLGETHLGRAAVERAPVHVEDVQQDPTLSGPDRGGLLEGIHAVLAVPLLREDKVVGGLVIRRRTAGGFAPTIPTLLQTFAGQAVLAIENARLFQELMARGEEARRARAAAEAALADLRRAQDRLIQSEKMASLGQLTAGIAHEIKNPLNFVNNFASLSVELLQELKETAAPAIAGLAEDERADVDEIVGMLTGNLKKIAEHGRRADGIVKSMLEHSRGVSGERREVDLNALIDEALNLAYHGARAQDAGFNITLERDLDPAATPIELAPQEMTRVFLNLFGNGFYAADKRARGNGEAAYRPTLQVSTRDLGEAVEIRVRDNGTGIAPEIRDQLFQPFFTTKPTGEGTGLGLSISWDIVTQQHGGSIEVDSREGEFTEFTIRLPRNGQAAGSST